MMIRSFTPHIQIIWVIYIDKYFDTSVEAEPLCLGVMLATRQYSRKLPALNNNLNNQFNRGPVSSKNVKTHRQKHNHRTRRDRTDDF